MPWFKVDDSLSQHRKAMLAGDEALGLWVLAGSWCARMLTDGFIPDYVAASLAPRRTAEKTRRLVSAGLWRPGEKNGEKGWFFENWSKFQPTRDQIETKRASEAKRKAEARKRARLARYAKSDDDVRADTGRTPDGLRAESQGVSALARPDPTRPDPYKDSLSVHDGVDRQPQTSQRPVAAATQRQTRRGYSDEFEAWWREYPRRDGPNPKRPASLAYARARKQTSQQQLLDAVRAFAVSRAGQDPRYTPQATTWLDQARWADDPSEQTKPRSADLYEVG